MAANVLSYKASAVLGSFSPSCPINLLKVVSLILSALALEGSCIAVVWLRIKCYCCWAWFALMRCGIAAGQVSQANPGPSLKHHSAVTYGIDVHDTLYRRADKHDRHSCTSYGDTPQDTPHCIARCLHSAPLHSSRGPQLFTGALGSSSRGFG